MVKKIITLALIYLHCNIWISKRLEVAIKIAQNNTNMNKTISTILILIVSKSGLYLKRQKKNKMIDLQSLFINLMEPLKAQVNIMEVIMNTFMIKVRMRYLICIQIQVINSKKVTPGETQTIITTKALI